jgi:hypothetical protein
MKRNFLILTLERTIPKVATFILEVIPIFFGYAMFGVSYFSSWTTRFATLGDAFVTLFSLLNGDVLQETFQDLVQWSPVIAQLYLYSFVMLGSYVVLNIVIAIVEESFFQAKEAKKKGQFAGRREYRARQLEESLLGVTSLREGRVEAL